MQTFSPWMPLAFCLAFRDWQSRLRTKNSTRLSLCALMEWHQSRCEASSVSHRQQMDVMTDSAAANSAWSRSSGECRVGDLTHDEANTYLTVKRGIDPDRASKIIKFF